MPAAPLLFQFDQHHSSGEVSEATPETLPAAPAFSATNEDTEGWRLPRLAMAWGAACSTVRALSCRYQHHWDGAVVEMRDHKGTLEVAWRDEQSRVMFEGVLVGAWERQGECVASHSLAT